VRNPFTPRKHRFTRVYAKVSSGDSTFEVHALESATFAAKPRNAHALLLAEDAAKLP
jgi:hypothetical protein